MKKEDSKILQNHLSTLVKRFSKSNVILEMEKNYDSVSSKEIPVNRIDDNSVLKKAPISKQILNEVSESLGESGFSSPLVVRPKNDYFEVVFGRKRLLACKVSQIEKVPAIVIDINDEEMLLMLLADIRNHRESNIVELAYVCKELSDKYYYSQQNLAILTHQSRSQITNTLRILNLPNHLVEDVSLGKLSYGHAKAIASLPESLIEDTSKLIFENKLSVRETEKIAQRFHNSNNTKVESKFGERFNCKCDVKNNSVTFKFSRKEELEDFLNKISK